MAFLILAQLIFGLSADVEAWPWPVDDWIHASHGAGYVEYGPVRVLIGFHLQMHRKTKENAIHLLNAENGSVLTRRHGVEIFYGGRYVEIGLRYEKVSAAMFNHRWQFWYDNHHRREISEVPTVGYYEGVRPYVRHNNFELFFPLIKRTSTLGYPLLGVKGMASVWLVHLSASFKGPWIVPWKTHYPDIFEIQAAYRILFVRYGRVPTPLAIETRLRRPRLALGISLSLTGTPK